jgi:hypothetical protein
MSSPSHDGTMTDEVIANAESQECRGQPTARIGRFDGWTLSTFSTSSTLMGHKLVRRRRLAHRSLTR